MNPILEAFIVGVINGITQTLWFIIFFIALNVFLAVLSNRDDDDDNDGGTLQPVHQGADK